MQKRRDMVGCLLAAVLLSTASGDALGQEFAVSDVTAFQNALTSALGNGEDDVIVVAAGTYILSATLTYTLSNLSAENFSLTIEGSGPAATILDGNNAVQILNIYTETVPDDGNAHFIVRGMTLRNGRHAGQAAGLSIWTQAAAMTVENCVFSNNISTGTGYGDGGGARLRSQSGGNITVQDSEFDGNSAYYGGGAWAISYSGINSVGVVQFANNRFFNNTARFSFGGAYGYSTRGSVAFHANIFWNNSTTFSGGGAWAEVGSGSSSAGAVILLANNIFASNSAATYNGGGAYANGGYYGTTYVFNNTFVDNSATLNGGGLYVHTLSLTFPADLYNNIFWNNTAGGMVTISMWKTVSTPFATMVLRCPCCITCIPISLLKTAIFW